MIKNNFHFIPFCLIFVSIGFLAACGGETETAVTENNQEQAAITQAEPDVKLNINTASDEAIMTIPEMNDHMLHEFKEYRPYVSIRQFRQEIGKYVDEAQVAEYEQYIYVPVNYNESDAATLQQIPGLEASEAEELTANRPFESEQAFLDALSSYINEQQMETAMRYLENQ